MTLFYSLKRILSASSLHAAFLYGFTGLGFVGANLIFAKVFTPQDYGIISVVISLINISTLLAPLGLDGVIIRQHLSFNAGVYRWIVCSSALVALATSAIALVFYHLDLWLLTSTFLCTLGGGTLMLAATGLQRQQRIILSLFLTQSPNFFLLLASLLLLASNFQVLWLPMVILILGQTAMGVWGLRQSFGVNSGDEGHVRAVNWKESFAYAGVVGAGLMMMQMERLMLPIVLDYEELARFSVLASIAIAPYRTLQLGAGFTLLPRLRAAGSGTARWWLVLTELAIAGVLVGAGSIVVWFVTPIVVDWIFSEKYAFEPALILAAIVAGILRVLGGFAKGVSTAVCTTRELAILNSLIWLAVLVSAAGALWGAHWGLIGVIYGVATGWLMRVIVCFVISMPHLRPSESIVSEIVADHLQHARDSGRATLKPE